MLCGDVSEEKVAWEGLSLKAKVQLLLKHKTSLAVASRPNVIKFRNTIKNKALTEIHNTASKIITSALPNFDSSMYSSMPKTDSLKRIIRNCRKKNSPYPKNIPQSLEEINLSSEFKRIKIGMEEEDFLMYDSGLTILPGRMLIFSTVRNLGILKDADEWFAEGTFDFAPTI